MASRWVSGGIPGYGCVAVVWVVVLCAAAAGACTQSRLASESGAEAGMATGGSVASGDSAIGDGDQAPVLDADAVMCPELPSGQSQRPDCPEYCPPEPPLEGGACAQTGHRCPYGSTSCQCAGASDTTWTCAPVVCMWLWDSTSWAGDDCDHCPTDEQPSAGVDYGPCTADAPLCRRNAYARFDCIEGRLRFESIMVP